MNPFSSFCALTADIDQIPSEFADLKFILDDTGSSLTSVQNIFVSNLVVRVSELGGVSDAVLGVGGQVEFVTTSISGLNTCLKLNKN